MKNNFYILIFLLSGGCASSSHIKDAAIESTKTRECPHTETSFNCVEVVEVYDGDSIFINLPSQHPLFGKRMVVRILGSVKEI